MPPWTPWAVSSVLMIFQNLSMSVGYPFLGLWARPGPPEASAIPWWHNCHAHVSGHEWAMPVGIQTPRLERGMHALYLKQQNGLVPPKWMQSVATTPVTYIVWVTRLALITSCPGLLVTCACICFSSAAILPQRCGYRGPSPFKFFTSAPYGEQTWFVF